MRRCEALGTGRGCTAGVVDVEVRGPARRHREFVARHVIRILEHRVLAARPPPPQSNSTSAQQPARGLKRPAARPNALKLKRARVQQSRHRGAGASARPTCRRRAGRPGARPRSRPRSCPGRARGRAAAACGSPAAAASPPTRASSSRARRRRARARTRPASAGSRRFGPLVTLRAHTNPAIQKRFTVGNAKGA